MPILTAGRNMHPRARPSDADADIARASREAGCIYELIVFFSEDEVKCNKRPPTPKLLRFNPLPIPPTIRALSHELAVREVAVFVE